MGSLCERRGTGSSRRRGRWRVGGSRREPCWVFFAFFSHLVSYFVASIFSLFFRWLFGSLMVPCFLPTWPPKPTRIKPKSMPRRFPILTSFLDRFWLPTSTPKSQLNTSPLAFSWFFRLNGYIVFGFDLGANLVPFSFENPQGTDLKRHQKFDRFLLRFLVAFGSVLGANLEPCWPLFSAQDGPRGFQDGSRCPRCPRCPARTRSAPIPPPFRPQDGPKTPQEGPMIVFWLIFVLF